MGGAFPFPPALVYGLLVLVMLPLPFVTSLVMWLVAGPRERILRRGFKLFVLALVAVGMAAALGKKTGPIVATPLAVALVVVLFKYIAETTWWRALLGVVLSAAVYGGLAWAFFR